jgi:hypothetical protein
VNSSGVRYRGIDGAEQLDQIHPGLRRSDTAGGLVLNNSDKRVEAIAAMDKVNDGKQSHTPAVYIERNGPASDGHCGGCA